ncbi:MAG: hypothetical protein ACO263_06785 [Cyclobacteriaceae bacterium]
MNFSKPSFVIFLFLVFTTCAWAQGQDSLKSITTYTGSIGFTNNGISIIPSFSLNKPALVTILSWRKNKFSVGPDIRITPTLEKGGMLLWFRYHAIEKRKFSLRLGTHPALNIQLQQVIKNGVTYEISQARRFLAWELAPTFYVRKNLALGLYYLQGNGLQLDGPRTSHFVNLTAAVSRIKISKNLSFNLITAFYYLNLDGNDGLYLNGSGTLQHSKLPLSLGSTFNYTFTSTIPNNKDFMWNATLAYIFRKTFVRKDS